MEPGRKDRDEIPVPAIDDAVAEALRKSGEDSLSGAGEGMRLHPIESVVLGGLLLVVTGLLVLQMGGRFARVSTFSWSEEAARYAFIWVVFVGAGVAVRTQSHIMADILRPESDGLLSKAWLTLLELVVLVAALCLLKFGIDLVRITANMRSVGLGISMAYVAAAIPVGASIMALYAAANVARLLRPILKRM